MTSESATGETTASSSFDLARLRSAGVVALVVLLIDQVTKAWAVAALDDGPIDLVGSLRLRLIYNTGASFGLGGGFGRWIGVLVIVVVVAVVVYAGSLPDLAPRLLLGAIVGGAIGNLIDRLFRAEQGFMSGGVVDFIDLQWWPVFNVADIAVVCGAIGLALYAMRAES